MCEKRHFLKLLNVPVCCSCSFYKQREYFITGGGDGQVKVTAACNNTVIAVFLLFHGSEIFFDIVWIFFYQL